MLMQQKLYRWTVMSNLAYRFLSCDIYKTVSLTRKEHIYNVYISSPLNSKKSLKWKVQKFHELGV